MPTSKDLTAWKLTQSMNNFVQKTEFEVDPPFFQETVGYQVSLVVNHIQHPNA